MYFDGVIREIMHQIFDTNHFGDGNAFDQGQQAYLPLRYGGLGIPRAQDSADAAYVASWWGAALYPAGTTLNLLILFLLV